MCIELRRIFDEETFEARMELGRKLVQCRLHVGLGRNANSGRDNESNSLMHASEDVDGKFNSLEVYNESPQIFRVRACMPGMLIKVQETSKLVNLIHPRRKAILEQKREDQSA